MLQIDLRANLRQFERSVSAAASKQIPFAAVQALTTLARTIVVAEQANEQKVLNKPKPFTTNALGVIRADKRNLRATVFMKDITARYLEPYEFGGRNVLNSRALLMPIGAVKDLDQYGNLPRNFIKKMQGRSDIFIGPVRSKSGVINGVWQRTTKAGGAAAVSRVGKDRQRRIGKTRKALNNSGRLVLLVRFADAHEARQHLGWFDVARHVVGLGFERDLSEALWNAAAS